MQSVRVASRITSTGGVTDTNISLLRDKNPVEKPGVVSLQRAVLLLHIHNTPSCHVQNVPVAGAIHTHSEGIRSLQVTALNDEFCALVVRQHQEQAISLTSRLEH